MKTNRAPATDRTVLLICLSVPILLAAVAFVVAVAMTTLGAPAAGTGRATVTGIAYVYLTLGFLVLPGYAVGCTWFWWATRGPEVRLMTRLYLLPLVGALCSWFPTLVFMEADLASRLRAFPMFATACAVAGYLCVGFARLTFLAWRRR